MLVSLPLPDGSICKLNVTEYGEKNAPHTLFCVHGLTRNGCDFDVLAKAAADKGFRVICPDMPGRGKSDWLTNPAFYNNLINAQLCLALLASMSIQKVDWGGTSMGGLIALLIANQAPTLIDKLVLNDVGCVVPAASLQRIGSYVGNSPVYSTFADAEAELKRRTLPFAIPSEHWADFAANSIERVSLLPPPLGGRDGVGVNNVANNIFSVTPLLTSPPLGGRDIELYGRLIEKTNEGYRLAYDPAIALGLGEIAQDIEMWPLWEVVKAIPTLLIRGAQSDLLTASTAQTMQATHPNLRYYEVANAGHAPSLMSDAEILKIIYFLNNLT